MVKGFDDRENTECRYNYPIIGAIKCNYTVRILLRKESAEKHL